MVLQAFWSALLKAAYGFHFCLCGLKLVSPWAKREARIQRNTFSSVWGLWSPSWRQPPFSGPDSVSWCFSHNELETVGLRESEFYYHSQPTVVTFILNFFRNQCASGRAGPSSRCYLELLCVGTHDRVTKQPQSIQAEGYLGVSAGLHFLLHHHPFCMQ